MPSAKVLSAAMALSAARLVAGASTCTKDIEITEPTPSIDCDIVDADITVDSEVAGALAIEGPKQIKGNLIISNATKLLSISSSSINSVGGRLELSDLELLNSVSFTALESLNELTMRKLNLLPKVTFGSEGVTEASVVTITDTFINDLSGLKLTTVETLQIDNNRKLIKFDSDLENITDTLSIGINGAGMSISMSKLEGAGEVQLQSVKAFNVPNLEKAGSLKFDKCNEMESFSAPNLTEIKNSISFIDNKKISNITFPKLTKIGGDLTVRKNPELTELEAFPKLESVFGGIDLGGDFEKVELPKLNDVSGSVNVSSTTDIKDFCGFFDDAKDDGSIRGEEKCTSNNKEANEGGAEGGENADGSSGDNAEDAAGIISVNSALLGLAAIAGLAQLL